MRTLSYQGSGPVQKLATSWYHMLIIKTDGTLWATGDNGSGQLGTGDNNTVISFTRVLSGVSAIACGSWHSLVLKTDGTL